MIMTRRLLLGLCAAVMTAAVPDIAYCQYNSDYSELSDGDVAASLRSHISFLSSAAMEGRAAGSAGERDAADYVRRTLESYGVDILSGTDGDLFGLSLENGDTLTSRNVIGFVQGYDRTIYDRYIVVCARLDNLGTNIVNVDGTPEKQIFYGANGNASGLAVMMELARMVSVNSLLFRRSVIFMAAGASTKSLAGSWYFLNRSFGESGNIDAMINLDMLGTGDSGFYAYTSSNPDLNMILSRVSSTLQPAVPELTTAEPYPSDHRAFYAKEIPSVLFTSGKYPEHDTVKDTESIIQYGALERELEYIYNFTRYVSDLENPPLFRQGETAVKVDNKVYTYDECSVRPVFMGSSDPRAFLLRWVYQYLKYPKAAMENGVQGRVTVGFTVDRDGRVTDVKVLRSADPLLDAEAVKVVSASPKWKPGRVKGVNVSVSMSVAVDFKLTKKNKLGIKK